MRTYYLYAVHVQITTIFKENNSKKNCTFHKWRLEKNEFSFRETCYEPTF